MAGRTGQDQRERPLVQQQRTDGLIFILLMLAAVAAVVSTPGHLFGMPQAFGSLIETAATPGIAAAAGAVGDVQLLDISP